VALLRERWVQREEASGQKPRKLEGFLVQYGLLLAESWRSSRPSSPSH
jgi:hypothetical protein